ncbi:MAG: M48 family metallopeptidase [Cyanobacteria bacterium P01_F01_bin.53]
MDKPREIRLFSTTRKLYRRVVYGLVAMIMVLGIGVTTAQPSEARWWQDLLIQGVRVYQLSNMTDAQEVDLGRGINDQLVRSGQIKLYNGGELNSYIDDIGQALADVSDRPNIPYRFQIVEDDAVNAFATMGGHVYVTTGLIAAADNEAELAGVIGHEIGHIAGGHAREQMRQAAITQGITGALGVNRDRLVNIGAQIALQLPASRSAEYEADRHGFHSMGRAGYDQTGMVTFMQKLVRRGTPPEFLSTHPDARNRVNALQQLDSEAALPEATYGLSEGSYDANISSLR